MKTRFFCLLFYILMLWSFPLPAQKSWSTELSGIGTFSSPRVADLNGDGVGDIIMGAGREEFQACDTAIFALDGSNGKMLWKLSAADQMFGSAALLDINRDGTPDILINGRSAELQAINGKTGELIWKFFPPQDQKWFNFYNPQLVSDQDGDELKDILITNGGDVMVPAYDPNRPAGRLLLLSSANGSLIASANMPDGKETYMSVACLPTADHSDYRIILGTGGETVGGNLYVCKISDVLKEDLSGAHLLASSPDKGFIAPPVWVDVNLDSIVDIVANAVGGRLLIFDGATLEPLTDLTIAGTEAYSSLGVGFFDTDSIPDFMLSYAQGTWPDLTWNRQYMVSGSNGQIQFRDSLGYYQTSSPVVFDFTEDGRDDVLLTVNIHSYNELGQKLLYVILVVIDFSTGEVIQITEAVEGSNTSSTPWIGDMDQDGMLDIVYVHSSSAYHANTFDGLRIHRLATSIPCMTNQVRWGAYMGSNYDGIFSPRD
jgi:hypothetical protein